MSIVQNVLAEEQNRLESLAIEYERRLALLPRCSLHKRSIGGQVYVYGAERKNGKVVSQYIGKDGEPETARALALDKERRTYKQRLKETQNELATLRKMYGKQNPN
jgi:hypothetical protein